MLQILTTPEGVGVTHPTRYMLQARYEDVASAKLTTDLLMFLLVQEPLSLFQRELVKLIISTPERDALSSIRIGIPSTDQDKLFDNFIQLRKKSCSGSFPSNGFTEFVVKQVN